MINVKRIKHREVMLVIASLFYSVSVLSEVHVFDKEMSQNGSTIIKQTKTDVSANLLVIPVITTDTAFDPANNDLNSFDPGNPNLLNDIQQEFSDTNDFWREASYGQVGVTAKVLPRYYQVPRPKDFYVNATFQHAQIRTTSLTFPLVVPEGQFKVKVRFTASDVSTYTVNFEVADGPFATVQDLNDHINAELNSTRIDAINDGTRLNLRLESRRVKEGSFVVIDWDASDIDVIEALSLDAPSINEAGVELESREGTWPVNVPNNSELELLVLHENGTTESFTWSILGGTNYADAAAFASALNGVLGNAVVTDNGNRVIFDLTTASGDAVESILVSSSSASFPLTALGINMPDIQNGLVTASGTNTVRGSRRLMVGQAMAAYMMTELSRDYGVADIPDIAIDMANEAAITDAFNKNVDYDGTPDKPFTGYAVVFLDIKGKRAGASGGFIDSGIKNGGYLFTHQSHGKIQIIYEETGVGTVAHESGHNFGFPDLYNNSPGNYDANLVYPYRWDIMHTSALNQPGAWVKYQDSDWLINDGNMVEAFPMPNVPGAQTKRYALTPLDFKKTDYDDNLAGVPGNVDAVTKVVRLPIGFDAGSQHHYMILQNRQETAATNSSIPQEPSKTERGGLYLTDVITGKVFDYFTITTRNYVHPLTDRPLISSTARPIIDRDPSDDLQLLNTYPAYAGLSIDIVDEIPGPGGLANRPTYIVEVTREQSDFLDLSITPWNAPPWESPDIWIEHGDKDVADLSDVPLAGNGEPARWAENYDMNANGGKPLNWIRVKVSNNGTVDATDVQLKVKVNTPGGVGATGSWVELDLSEAKAVAAGDSTIFSVPWNPSVKGHTCIKVEIFKWNAPLGEVDFTNQGTQENINDFRPTAGSPWHPKPLSVDIENPFDEEMEVYLELVNLLPGISIDWDKASFVMEPNSKTKATGVMHIDESVIPTPQPDGNGGIDYFRWDCKGVDTTDVTASFEPKCRLVPGKPINRQMHLNAYAYAGDYRVSIGGVTYNVMPTLDLDIDVNVANRNGEIVVTGRTHPVAANETIEVEIHYPSGLVEWIVVTTGDDGRFEVEQEPKEEGKVEVVVNYPDGGKFAPVKVEGQLFDPSVTGVPGDSSSECWSCKQKTYLWLMNFVLLVAILIIVWLILIAIRRSKRG